MSERDKACNDRCRRNVCNMECERGPSKWCKAVEDAVKEHEKRVAGR